MTAWHHWSIPVSKIKGGALCDVLLCQLGLCVCFHRWLFRVWPRSTRTRCRQHDTVLRVRRITGSCHRLLGTGWEGGGGRREHGRGEAVMTITSHAHTMCTCPTHTTHHTTHTTHTHMHKHTHLQVRYHAATVNANEIANGVLSCLVAITSSCAVLQYFEACIVGGTDTYVSKALLYGVLHRPLCWLAMLVAVNM